MILSVSLIILFVLSILGVSAAQSTLLNQKMTNALQAQTVAFNSAEAGLVAEEAKIAGSNISLSDIPGTLTVAITSETVNSCQEHIFSISSTATYQNATVKLTSAYLKAHQPPLPECSADTNHRLWWSEI